MGVSQAAAGEFLELPRFERIEHANITHRQHQRPGWFLIEQAGCAPTRDRLGARNRAEQPGEWAGDQQGMQARRVARAFIEQILQATTDFDGKQIDIRIIGIAAEPQP